MAQPPLEPVHCQAQAYRLLARELPRLDTTPGLVRAAVAVARHEMPDSDPDAVEAALHDLGDQVRGRAPSGRPRALLAHGHAVLFEEFGLAGNTQDYANPRNSYLPAVLQTRRGLPIALALVYKAVMERAGLTVIGLNTPNHFLAGVDLGESEAEAAHPESASLMIVDPFCAGQALSRDEAVARTYGLSMDPDGPVAEAALRPATHRQWLLRIIQNLVVSFEQLDRRDDAAAMLELRMLVQYAG